MSSSEGKEYLELQSASQGATPRDPPSETQVQPVTASQQPTSPTTESHHEQAHTSQVPVDSASIAVDIDSKHTVDETKTDDTKPTIIEPTIIAFVNFNSGGKMGESIAGGLKKLLGDDHVFNLADGGPVPGLQKFRHVKNLMIAVCGGDGTVNWLLSVIHALDISPPPAVAIIPLGTGNDTARAFGWGKKFPGMKGIKRIIQAMPQSEKVPYDRFHLAISHPTDPSDKFLKSLPPSLRPMETYPIFFNQRNNQQTQDVTTTSQDEKHATATPEDAAVGATHVGHSPTHEASSVQFGQAKRQEHENITHLKLLGGQWNNYLSFGVDAQIIYEFHHLREQHRGLFCCRCCNMAWMGWFGTANCCCCQAKAFDVEIEVPNPKTGVWEKIDLPRNLDAVILLNLQTYAGGRRIWGKGKSGKNEWNGIQPSLSDGLIEVIGVTSSAHLGRMVSECQRGIRIGQYSELKFTSKNNVFVQLDGEPWEDLPCTYHIRRIDQSIMLNNTKVKI